MASPWSHDDKIFLTGKKELLENDALAVATKLLDKEAWKKLPILVEQMQNVGCLCVTGCGYSFSGLPLLYTFMTSGFKCPICRFGGNAQIDIAAAPPQNFCAIVWEAMCVLSNVVRKRDMLEKNNDESLVVTQMQMARHQIRDVYQSLPWVVRFVLYKESNLGMANAPFAQITRQMKVGRAAPAAWDCIIPDMVTLTSGML